MQKSFRITQVTWEIHSIVYTLKAYLFARISSGVCIILCKTIIISSNNINTVNFISHINSCIIEFVSYLNNKRNVSTCQ